MAKPAINGERHNVSTFTQCKVKVLTILIVNKIEYNYHSL
jgi:hypothetical protein